MSHQTTKINRSIKLVGFCKYSQVFFNRNGKYQKGELIVCTNAGRKVTTFYANGVFMEKLEY